LEGGYVDVPLVTAKERASFQKLLQKLQRTLTAKGASKIAPNRNSDEEVGGDEDEQPLNEMLQAIASSRNRNQEVVLGRVQAALKKLREAKDDFGLCEDCGDEIGKGRLKAMPYAELCVTCQSKKDGPRAAPTRRNLTDFT
jgi:DnaK suppressor protein